MAEAMDEHAKMAVAADALPPRAAGHAERKETCVESAADARSGAAAGRCHTVCAAPGPLRPGVLPAVGGAETLSEASSRSRWRVRRPSPRARKTLRSPARPVGRRTTRTYPPPAR